MNGRDSLHSMGSLMDLDDDEENLPENHRAPSSQQKTNLLPQKTQQQQQNDDNNRQRQGLAKKQKPLPLGDKTEEMSTLTQVGNSVLAASSNMVRQHRRRLLAGGQVAASLLTPHNDDVEDDADNNNNVATSVDPTVPAWDGLVRKGTKLKSFLGDAMQHVATGYSVTSTRTQHLPLLPGSNKRQRLMEGGTGMEMEDHSDNYHLLDDESSLMSKHNQQFVERELAATSMAKDKAKEVLLLQQVCLEMRVHTGSRKTNNMCPIPELTSYATTFSLVDFLYSN